MSKESQAQEEAIFDALTEGEFKDPVEEPLEAASEAPDEEISDEEGDTLGSEDEAVEASSDDDQEPDPDTIALEEVEYEGVVYEVPVTLKDALLRQKDYTQKTQSVAEERQQVEVIKKQVEVQQKEQQFVSSIQPELNNIGYLQATIQQMETDLQSNLSNMTSEEMFKKKIEVDGYKEQMKALRGGLEAKYAEFEEAQKQSYEELLKEGAQVLKKVIPDWSETKQAEMRDFALAKGFSEQEVSSIIDPRHVEILYKASQYEALQAKAKPVEGAKSKTIQPKARPRKMDDSAKNRLAQNKIRKTKGLSNAEKADKLLDTKLDAFL